MTKLSNEEKLQRRLGNYPNLFWEILRTAQQGKEYIHIASTWHEAAALSMRFSRFRMDTIEARVPGSLDLREMSVTGVCADATIFSTSRNGPAPIRLTWRFMFGYKPKPGEIAPDVQVPGLPSGGLQLNDAPQGQDAHEDFMKDWLKKPE